MQLRVLIFKLVPFAVIRLVVEPEIRAEIDEQRSLVKAAARYRLAESVRQRGEHDLRRLHDLVRSDERHIYRTREIRKHLCELLSLIAHGADRGYLNHRMAEQQPHKLRSRIARRPDYTNLHHI